MFHPPVIEAYARFPGLMTGLSVLAACVALAFRPRTSTYAAMAAAVPGSLPLADIMVGLWDQWQGLRSAKSSLYTFLAFAVMLPSVVVGPAVLIRGALKLARYRKGEPAAARPRLLLISLVAWWAVLVWQEFVINYLGTPEQPMTS